jgi:hypothetical protein
MYGSVMRWRGKFRMWYCGWTRDPKPVACYAESDDGVVWHKPQLGLCEFDNDRRNNIILQSGWRNGLVDDLTVIDDFEDEEWPLKMLYYDSGSRKSDQPDAVPDGIYLARSKDGIHWDRSPGLVLPEWGDRFNAAPCKVNGKYVLLGRAPGTWAKRAEPFHKGRDVWRIESENLTDWSTPQPVLARDEEDPPQMEYYSSTIFPYGDLLVGGLERMHMSPDKLDTEIIWSHDDGHKWQRARTRPIFIPWRDAPAWDDTWINLPASAPISRAGRYGNQLWFYYSGRSGAHASLFPHNQGGIGLATLRIDGFASLQAEEKMGFVLTKPVDWPEADLHINVDPRRNILSHPGNVRGEIAVEARNEKNEAINGFSWDDYEAPHGNTINGESSSQRAIWKNAKTLRELAGRRIRLAFRLCDCHLYSFRAVA